MIEAVKSQNIASIAALLKRPASEISDRLIPQIVYLSTSPQALRTRNGQLTTSLISNLLFRMYPLITTVLFNFPQNPKLLGSIPLLRRSYLSDAIVLLSEDIRAGVSVSSCRKNFEKVIHISVGYDPSANVCVANDGWVVSVNDGAEPSPLENPIGAYVAACVGVAEVLKEILHRLNLDQAVGRKIRPAEAFRFSTFDYSVGPHFANPQLPTTVDLDRLLIVGVGSGGSVTAMTLAAIQGVRGLVGAVDPDEIIDRNLQRYPFALAADAKSKAKKVTLAKRLLDQAGCECIEYASSYDEVSNELRKGGFMDLVVGTVHTGSARRRIQLGLPRVLLDAAVTERAELVVRRTLLGQTACMGCYYPKDTLYSEAKIFSELLGLNTAEVEHLRVSNGRFAVQQVQRIRHHVSEPNFIFPEPSERWGDWRHKCGRLPLGKDRSNEVPVPHVTALAGVLVAGEVVKERIFPEAALNSYYLMDTLGRISPHYPTLRSPQPDCDICQDADTRSIFEHHYKRL